MERNNPKEICIECGSNNIKMIYEGLETDTYKCLDCKKKFGITDMRRLAGFTKKEIEEMDRNMKIFLIGDLHLGHANIIKYCKRPFSSVEEMNNVIINNWNKTVKQNDLVYFLGDMAFGTGSRKTEYWLDKLKGDIIFIKGSHDRSKKIKFFHNIKIKHKNQEFLLIHNPQDATKQWKSWIIHAHHHNNDLENYPFINGKNKTINVAVEVINYKPLNINKLFKLNFKNIKRMDTINSIK